MDIVAGSSSWQEVCGGRGFWLSGSDPEGVKLAALANWQTKKDTGVDDPLPGTEQANQGNIN